MATMTLEPAVDSPCPRMTVTVTGLVSGVKYVLWRQVDGEPRQGVRGGTALRGPATFLVDGEAPLGRPVRYDLVGPSGEVVVTERGQVDSTTAWLHDPTELRTAIPIHVTGPTKLGLAAGSLGEWTHQMPAQTYPVLGSTIPWASTGVPQAPSGIPFIIRAVGQGNDQALRRLLETVPVLCLRTLPRMDELTAVGYVLAGPRKAQTTVRDGEQRREWSMTLDVVRPPALSIIAPVWTWQTLRDTFPKDKWTWGDVHVALAGRTWLEIRRDPRP